MQQKSTAWPQSFFWRSPKLPCSNFYFFVQGQFPGWAWGSQRAIRAPRLKRWINQLGSSADNYEPKKVSKDQSNFSPKPSRTIIRTTTPDPVDRNDPNWAVNQYNNLINSRKNNHAGNNNNNNIDNNHPAANNHNFMQNNNNPFPNYNRNSNPQRNNQKPNPPKRRPFKNNVPQRQTTAESQNLESIPDTNVGVGGKVRNLEVASEYLQSFKANIRSCMGRKSNVVAHDANVWIKTPGESDGRMYRYGVFRNCLLDHSIPCDDTCQMFVQANIDRDPSCQCTVTLPESIREPPGGSFSHSDFPFK